MQLAFDVATYHERIEQVRRSLDAQGLDALIVTMPDSIHWLTGYDTIGYLWSQALLVERESGEPTLHTRTTEEPGVRETSWLTTAVFYDIATQDPVAVLADTVRKRGLAKAKIGVDLQAFTLLPIWWEGLKRELPDAELVDGSEIVPELRVVKTPAELAYQRQAAEMADYAMRRAFEQLRPGLSEVELAGIIAHALGEAGSEYAAIPPMVVSGPRSALVHGMATRRTISRGDVVCMEFAGTVHRYHGILMRSAVIGRPSEDVVEAAACLEEAIETAIAGCKVGAPVHQPDDACNAVLDRKDLARRRCHRLGYSTGVAYPPGWLEPMTLVAGDEHVFQQGMSFTVEPNISLQDRGFGLKCGDTVEATPEGGRSMSALGHGLTIID
jgi:Xaa-Pro dipeptidase